MAAHFDPELPEPQAMRMAQRNRERLQKLADRLWHERMLGSAKILVWTAQHRFYLAVENPGLSRLMRLRRHIRILITRTIDADVEFAGRFGLRRDWQAHLIRPIRLSIKTFRPSRVGHVGSSQS